MAGSCWCWLGGSGCHSHAGSKQLFACRRALAGVGAMDMGSALPQPPAASARSSCMGHGLSPALRLLPTKAEPGSSARFVSPERGSTSLSTRVYAHLRLHLTEPRRLLSPHKQHFPLIRGERDGLARASPLPLRGRRAGAGHSKVGTAWGPPHPHTPGQVAFARPAGPVARCSQPYLHKRCSAHQRLRLAWARKAYFKLAGKRTLFGGN